MSMYDSQSILQTPEYRQELVAQRTFMARVYGWMTIGLMATALTSLVIASSTDLVKMIFGTPIFWGLIIAELGIAFFFGRALRTLPVAAAAAMFIVYSVLTGATLSIILLAYTASSVAATFFITAGMFGGMSVFGLVTRRDLSGMGSFLIMGLWGLVIAMVVNIFLRSSGLDWIISFIGVLIFTGLSAYDTQKIKQSYAMGGGDAVITQKTALYGAFALYLDFINLFLFLLRFMGDRRN